MKSVRTILFLFCLLVSYKAFAQDILSRIVNEKQIDVIAKNIDSWRKEKELNWRNALLDLPDSLKVLLIKEGENSLVFDWPSLKASIFLEYKQNGNRTNYESVLNERRAKFASLIKAELIEGKSRFIPQIINGLWLILEESTWVSPAHLSSQKLGLGLANVEDSFIDLGAGRQGLDVALTYFLFNKEFDKISKQINIRILHELNRRIIHPYLERDDFWWMASKGSFVNNWNIWINTNVLKTFLLVESNKETLVEGIKKILVSSDKFVNYYPEDGACEEGPSYWMHAGGELGGMLTWLKDVSMGSVDFSKQSKLRNMGTYIFRTHIVDNRYVNFADAQAVENVSPLKVWNYFKVFDDVDMGSFASYLAQSSDYKATNTSLPELLDYALVQNELLNHSPTLIVPTYFYYQSLGQVIYNNKVSDNNLFFSAIGSHNDASHNHNDVGSFMLYYNGNPIFIDVGVGTYNSKTFSKNRYDIWNMQSQWHNLPIINGIGQKAGKQFRATAVESYKEGNDFVYSLDISEAYPKEASVKSWLRTFKLDTSSNQLYISENYELFDVKQSPELVFVSKFRPKLLKNEVVISYANKSTATIRFLNRVEDIDIEELLVEDVRIQSVWGEVLYRTKIRLEGKHKVSRVDYTISFH